MKPTIKPTRPYLKNERPPVPVPPPATAPPAAPRRGRLRGLMERAAEGAMAVLITLGCYLALLIVMSRIFPSTTDLRDLLASRGEETASWGHSRLAGSMAGLADPLRVSLFVLDNEVMYRDAQSIVWSPAREGATLSEGDGVQTTREGMAVLDFGGRNHMRLGRNSLIILHRPEQEGPSRHSRPTSFKVESGELWAEFGSLQDTIRVDVGGKNPVQFQAGGGGPSAFKVSVGEHHTSAIAVYQGTARLNTSSGSVPVRAREYVVLDSTGRAGPARRLPKAPRALAPADGERFTYRDFPPSITFRWIAEEEVEAYRIVIAKDPGFERVIVDERTEEPRWTLGSLAAGPYWWRATSILEGVDGPPSSARRLTLFEDRVAPVLAVSFPESRTQAASIAIEGTAEPGVRVYVAGEPAEVGSDGRFSRTTALKPGLNLVVVEAVDAAGNTSYRSQQIQRVVSSGGDDKP